MVLREDSNNDSEYTHYVCWICIFGPINNSEYIYIYICIHHWLSKIIIYFIIPAYHISNYTKKNANTYFIVKS